MARRNDDLHLLNNEVKHRRKTTATSLVAGDIF